MQQTQPVTWVNTDADVLEAAVRAYIDQHGVRAFLDEYYNLLGTRAQADFTAENHALAGAFGLAVPAEALPLTVPREDIFGMIYWAKLTLDRKFLARLFADPAFLPDLSELQRLFLEWHFLAPRNYSWSLVKGRRILLGWNDIAELHGPDDFAMYTNLMGCTGVFALAPDGSAHMSHYDDDNLNPAQTAALMDFLRRFPEAEVGIVGAHAEKMARHLADTRGLREILYHVKRIYWTTGYWVGFRRRQGQFQAVYCEVPLTPEYVPSTHYTEYGKWFIYGKFGETYPSPEANFREIPFETLA